MRTRRVDRSGRGERGWSLPIIWLYLGPPALRLADRSAAASLDAGIDVWNLVRVAWWAVVGLWALYSVSTRRDLLPALIRERLVVVVAAGLLVVSLLLSTAFSPSLLFSAANAGMMTILTVAALDLALRVREGTASPTIVARELFDASVWLLALLAVVFAISPSRVSSGSIGPDLRIEGGWIVDAGILAVVLLAFGTHLLTKARGWRLWLIAVALPVATALLLLSRSRTLYLAVGAAGLVWLFMWLGKVDWRASAKAIGAACLLGGAVCVVGLALLVGGRDDAFTVVGRYLVRDTASLSSMSGRTSIYAVLVEELPTRLLGSGFSAGPRAQLLASERRLQAGGVVASRIGNAHNAYLELLAGAGPVALLAFLSLAVATFSIIARAPNSSTLSFLALLTVGLVLGLTGSDIVLPFGQASATVWAAFGLAAGLTAEPRRFLTEEPLRPT